MRAILFDFYGVISIRHHQAFLEKAIPDHAKLLEIQQLTKQHDLGLISVEEYLEAIGRETALQPAEVLDHMHDERVINTQLVELIRQELKPAHKIGLVSNAAGDLRTFIPEALLAELFDDVLISATVGIVKPDPRIFTLACERLHVAPHEAVMIDDIPENCQGARAAGLAAIDYTTFPRCREQLLALLH